MTIVYNEICLVNLSVGFAGPYPDTSMTAAIQRVVDRGGLDSFFLKK
jgi:hypothetical protein